MFFGTDAVAVPVLNALEEKGFLPEVVVTAPDRASGREELSSPAKLWAEKRHIPVLQPTKLDEGFVLQLKAYSLQLFIVASYGKIIPPEIFNSPEHGTLNIHPSLLPKLRGPAPIQGTIISGEKAGVTIIKIDNEVDHGDILGQKEVTTEGIPHFRELEEKLGHTGGELLAEILPDYVAGKISAVPQDHDRATFTKKVTKKDGLINLSDDARINLRKIRAYENWPGTYFLHKHAKTNKEMRVSITDAEMESGLLKILKVVPEGRREMTWDDFTRGFGTVQLE